MLYIVQHMKCILNSQPKCFFHLINLKMSSHVLLWLLWMLICICHFLLNMFFLSFHGLLWMLWLPICMLHSTLTVSIAPLTQFWCCSQTLKGRKIFLFKGFFKIFFLLEGFLFWREFSFKFSQPSPSWPHYPLSANHFLWNRIIPPICLSPPLDWQFPDSHVFFRLFPNPFVSLTRHQRAFPSVSKPDCYCIVYDHVQCFNHQLSYIKLCFSRTSSLLGDLTS